MENEKPKGWDDKKMAQSFPITAVARFDIYDETKDVRAMDLTDEEMEYIAGRMKDGYITGGSGFWSDMVDIFTLLVEKKERKLEKG